MSQRGNGRRSNQHPLITGDVVKVTAFWQFVQVCQENDCWWWCGYVNEDGYGEFYWEGRMVGAHELALTFTTGERRHPSLDTCHSCGNPLCCNPKHLRFDTRQSNVADTLRHGRHKTRRKLSDADVLLIRERLEYGATQQKLADEFGVSNSTISMIKTGKRRTRRQHG